MKLIVLDATTKTIRAALVGAVATSNPDYVIAYADSTDSTFAEASTDGQLNGTTDVTLVGAPASGVKRTIKSISVYNRDTAPVIVVIKLDVSGTQRILQRVQLVSGETWHSDELTKLSPGGSDTQVQFNDTGTLAGSSNFTYNKTTSVLTLGANPVLSGGTANGVLYLNGSKVATSGSALTFDGSQFYVNGGASGIPLTLNNNTGSNTNLAFTEGGTAKWYLRNITGNGGFSFYDVNAASETMRLTSTGLGIGTSSPADKLQVLGTIRFGANATYYGTITHDASSTGANIYNHVDSGGHLFQVGGSTLMNLNASGNLGLGVTPSAWRSTTKALQSTAGAIYDFSTTGKGITQNAYLREAPNAWTYINNGPATQYDTGGGTHIWYTAPSGTAGNAITFTQAMTLDASGNLGVGTTSPTTRLHLAQSNSGNYASVILLSNSANAAADRTGIYGSTTPGNALPYRGGITFWPGDVGTLTFHTGNNASPGDGERVRITSGGYFKASNTGSYVNSTGSFHEFVTNQQDNLVLYLRNTNATSPYGFDLNFSATPNNTTNYFFIFSDGAGNRMVARSNGGIANYSANNVNLSDRREKTNFSPAGEYLSKICAIPVQTFNYIDQSEDDPGSTLGVVAQDVQAVAPELVTESNWGSEDNPKMRLSIYQTDLQYALMKCIQEQQALITSLTARVAALEGTQP